MQEQKVSNLLMAPLTSRFSVPFTTELTVNIAGYKRGLDYPCGCRHCLKVASRSRTVSPLAAIDVYDVPDGPDFESDEYFH